VIRVIEGEIKGYFYDLGSVSFLSTVMMMVRDACPNGQNLDA